MCLVSHCLTIENIVFTRCERMLVIDLVRLWSTVFKKTDYGNDGEKQDLWIFGFPTQYRTGVLWEKNEHNARLYKFLIL